MSPIRWLGDDDCHHHAIVGGKAASLSRLAALHAVPHGFAVSALPALQSAIPETIIPRIRSAYGALGERCGVPEPAVAVRSSALDEDGSDASFAGQHDTYLNIRGHDAVLDAVARCIQSAASREALAYRQARGLAIDGVRIAVLVQELVPSDVSAVVFSANPVTGSRDEVMINSNWGLGESIVSGTATPDTFIIAKHSLEVTERYVAQKDRMTVTTAAGTTDVDVPAELREKSSLDDSQIAAMTRLALMLESALGHAVDIECAFARSNLYLLQCRPITTLG